MRNALFHCEAVRGEQRLRDGQSPGTEGDIGRRTTLALVLTAVVALLVAACSDSGGVGASTGPSAISTLSLSSSGGTVASGRTVSALTEGVTDVTLANAGWTCIQPGNGLTLCAPPGTGVPPIPPAADGQATYDLMAFTLDHQFFHHVKLLRLDLYHGQPCLGGDDWIKLDFLGYYECIIPGRGEG